MKQKINVRLVLLILLSLLVCWSLYQPGFFYTHDSTFHVIKLHHYLQSALSGIFPVRWAPLMANGYGYPIFNYTYPLPYILGSLLAIIGFSLGTSLKTILLISTVGSVWGMYKLLSEIIDEKASFIGSLVYLLVPFRFLTLFVTGQIGATLVMFFTPWLLLFIWRLSKKTSWKNLAWVSVFASLMVLSHLISVIVVGPLILGFILFSYLSAKSKSNFLKAIIASALLSLTTTAFYVVPALTELEFVAAGYRSIVDFSGHFVDFKQLLYSAWGYGYSNPGVDDGMSFQIGFAQIFSVLIGMAILLFIRTKKKTKFINLLLIMLIIFLISVWLMTDYSNIIWQNFKILQRAQHPWRFLLSTSISTSIIAALIYKMLGRFKLVFAVFVIFLALVNNRNYLRPMERARYMDDHYLNNPSDLYGTGDISAEFLPMWANTIPAERSEPLLKEGEGFEIKNPTEGNLVRKLPKIFYPGLVVVIDDQMLNAFPDTDGLALINLPPGNYTASLYYHPTTTQYWSSILSLVSMVFLLKLILNKDII